MAGIRRIARVSVGKGLADYQRVMSTLIRLLQNCLGVCTHPHTIRERRKLHGVDVLHLVCENCGHAVPALQRSAGEHQRMARLGAVRRGRAHRAPAAVVEMNTRRAIAS